MLADALFSQSFPSPDSLDDKEGREEERECGMIMWKKPVCWHESNISGYSTYNMLVTDELSDQRADFTSSLRGVRFPHVVTQFCMSPLSLSTTHCLCCTHHSLCHIYCQDRNLTSLFSGCTIVGELRLQLIMPPSQTALICFCIIKESKNRLSGRDYATFPWKAQWRVFISVLCTFSICLSYLYAFTRINELLGRGGKRIRRIIKIRWTN